jgi:hypothetical protein
LEEQRTKAKIRVRNDSCVAFLLDYISFDGGIVKQSELRVCLLSDVVEEVIAQFHRYGEAFEDVHTQHIALVVE